MPMAACWAAEGVAASSAVRTWLTAAAVLSSALVVRDQTTRPARWSTFTHTSPCFSPLLTAMADMSALSQLLEASLDPRRNKQGK
jgi:hypothetical protein